MNLGEDKSCRNPCLCPSYASRKLYLLLGKHWHFKHSMSRNDLSPKPEAGHRVRFWPFLHITDDNHWVMPTTCEEFKFLFMFSIRRSPNKAASLTNLDFFKDSPTHTHLLPPAVKWSFWKYQWGHITLSLPIMWPWFSIIFLISLDHLLTILETAPHIVLTPVFLSVFRPIGLFQPFEDLPLSEMCKDPLLSFQDSSLCSV